MNIAEHICNYLVAYNVRYIFGYPGAAILPLMDAINKHPQLEWVLMRHEGAAAFAATAQAKLTQRLTVCMASTGPGTTNLLTGISDADLDRAPVLVITGSVAIYKHNLSHFQDIDQLAVLASCCGFNVRGEHPLQFPQLLQNAIGYVIRNRRPAHVSIASDLQSVVLTPHQLESANHQYHRLHSYLDFMYPPAEVLDDAAQILLASENIIIAVGPRALHAGPDIERLAEKLHAPIVCSFASKGIINENHPNYFGVLGLFSAPASQCALSTIKNAKLVLAFGIDDLVYFVTDHNLNQIRELMQIEPDVTSLSHHFVPQKVLLGPLDKIAAKLSLRVSGSDSSFLIQAQTNRSNLQNIRIKKSTTTAPGTVHQRLFIEKLNPFVDQAKMVLALDIGDSTIWAIKYLRLTHYQLILVSNRLGCMGFCLPALIAAKLEKPDHLVVGICGDGGLQMILGELNTAAQLDVNIIIIIFNNGTLQRVAAQQNSTYGTVIKNPDFTELAKCCGFSSIKIKHTDEIEPKLRLAFAIKKGPVLIEVMCDPAVYATMHPWVAP